MYLTYNMVWAVIGLSLTIVIGLLIVLAMWVWDWAFTCILDVLNLKKEFIQFVYDKYHKQKVISPKIE